MIVMITTTTTSMGVVDGSLPQVQTNVFERMKHSNANEHSNNKNQQ